jgi:hypothetical protein
MAGMVSYRVISYNLRWSTPTSDRSHTEQAQDPSSIAWMYHSHADEPDDTNTGLMGPIIITSKGEAEEDGSPNGVDHEFFTLFTIYDENKSQYLDYQYRALHRRS